MGEAPWVSCLLEEEREKEESVYRLFTVRQTQHTWSRTFGMGVAGSNAG